MFRHDGDNHIATLFCYLALACLVAPGLLYAGTGVLITGSVHLTSRWGTWIETVKGPEAWLYGLLALAGGIAVYIIAVTAHMSGQYARYRWPLRALATIASLAGVVLGWATAG